MMPSMEQPKITVQNADLGTLLNMMGQGQLQIPRFQRNFVWSVTKTRELLDSMIKEFPIGTFFFWRAPSEYQHLFREAEEIGIPAPDPGFSVTYILDGQQRLTSLFATIRGVEYGSRDYGRISVDLKTVTAFQSNHSDTFEQSLFVYRKPDNKRYVSLSALMSQERSFPIYDQIPAEWRSAFQYVRQRFQNYPFSVVWVRDQPLGEVVEIFQRINQGGKRLSRYDLVCANLWHPDFNFRNRVDAYNQRLKEKGFGELFRPTISQTFALIIHDRCTTASELSMKTEEVQEVWDEVIDSLNLAIDFAEANLGVKRADFLPYRGFLAVLAYFFYHSPKSAIPAAHRRLLWDWFWRVTLSERYSSASDSRMAEDANALRKVFDGEDVTFDYQVRVTPEAVRRVRMTTASSALRNAVLCLLALRGPRNLKDGSPLNLSRSYYTTLKKAERHHIFPVGFLKKHGISGREVHRVPNFCFIPADLNKEISSQAPSTYLRVYEEANPNFETAAAAQLVPVGRESPLWDDDYDAFLDRRSQVISEALHALVQDGPLEPAEGTFEYEDKKAEVVKIVELRLRDLINDILYDVAGDDYWKEMIPGGVRNDTKKNISRHINHHPYQDWEDYPPGRARLDFAVVSHYEQIIMSNWGHFESVFGHKNAFQQHITNFRIFRNAVAHNKDLNEVEQNLAVAAVKWLQQSLDHYAEQQEIEESFEEEELAISAD